MCRKREKKEQKYRLKKVCSCACPTRPPSVCPVSEALAPHACRVGGLKNPGVLGSFHLGLELSWGPPLNSLCVQIKTNKQTASTQAMYTAKNRHNLPALREGRLKCPCKVPIASY